MRVARDRELDVLRGWAIVLMIFSHVGPLTRIGALAHLPLWISAAEPFVLLSGVVLGMRSAAGLAPRSSWQRARQFWIIHCVLMSLVLVVHELTGRLRSPDVAAAGGWARALLDIATLRLQALDYMNILPLFVVFFLFAPALVWAMRAGWSWACLLLSAALWLAAQRYPAGLRYTDPASGPEAFVLPAWQFVFFLGLILGYHRASVRSLWARHAGWLRAGLFVVTLGLFGLAQLQRPTFRSRLPEWLIVSDALVDKAIWGPLRAAYVLCLLASGYLLLRWLRRTHPSWFERAFEPLELMGRVSLYCFLIHLAPALAASALGVDFWPALLRELTVVAAVGFVYVMARHGVLARYIPR